MLDDPRLVKFSNEKLRILADTVEAALRGAELAIAEYDAAGLVSTITSPAEQIVDGSPADGRNPIVGQSVMNYIQNLRDILAIFNTADEQGITLRNKNRYLAVNPRSPF